MWQSLDLVLHCVYSLETGQTINDPDDVQIICVDASGQTQTTRFSAKESQFLWECLRTAAVSGAGVDRMVRLIVPLQTGYIVRSDIIPLRLQDSEHIEAAIFFADPLQNFPGHAVVASDHGNLASLLSTAAAGLVFTAYSTEVGIPFLAVDLDLEGRLSFPCIVLGPARDKTLVLVDANGAHPGKGDNVSSLHSAAQALGIKLVVFDNGDHWLEEPEYAHWCEAFIPTRLTNPPEDDLTNPLLESGKPSDGIITFADSYWTYIADAAKQEGIPTAPSEALQTATNKYLTSNFVGHEAYRASGLAEALDTADKIELPYPLIVKPCDGWSSEGVSRVDSFDKLTVAIDTIALRIRVCHGEVLCRSRSRCKFRSTGRRSVVL